MSLQIRETTAVDDFQFIANFVENARTAGERWASSWTRSLILSEFQSARVFVATLNGATSAFLLIRPPGSAWEITLTAVLPSFRKTGVFTAMLSQTLAELRRDALTVEVHLEVRADNLAAIAAYEACGFVAVGRRRAYYPDGTDALLYSRA